MPSGHRPWFASILITATLAAYTAMPSHISDVPHSLRWAASQPLPQEQFDRHELEQATQMLTTLKTWLDRSNVGSFFQKLLQ